MEYDEELESERHKPAFGWISGSLGCSIGTLIYSLPIWLVVFAVWAGISIAQASLAAKAAGVPFNHWWIFYW